MSVYSSENIERLLKRLLIKKGINTSIIPNKFVNLEKKIKQYKSNRCEWCKKKKLARRELAQIGENEEINDSLKANVISRIMDIDEEIQKMTDSINECEKKRDEEIKQYANELLIKIRSKRIELKLNGFELSGKLTFTTADLDSKVIEQLIKQDIAKHYKRKPADRNIIIEQLRGLLGNRLPKYIIRADIKSFFESVSIDKLLKKLGEEGYVSAITMRYLKKIQNDIKAKGGEGVPRGLAFSSYLTEIYLQRVDDDIRNLPKQYFYQRYVDDIVVLFAVDKDVQWQNLSKEINVHWNSLKEIFNRAKLSLHEEGDKKSLIYSGKSNKNEFDYLGYKFLIKEGKLTIRLSSNRRNRYEEKIGAIIDHYNRTAHDNQSLSNIPQKGGKRRRKREQPLRRLFGQLSALTGNGMLKGLKSNILTGVYYSNQYLSSLEDFIALDILLRQYIEKHLEIPTNMFKYSAESDSLSTIKGIKQMMIEKWSFVEGFKNKRFCKSSSYFNRLNQIKRLSK